MSTPQLPLTLRPPPDQRFATFHGHDRERAALTAAASGAAEDWLFVAGPAGSGKTHLLLAACAAAGEHGRRAVYLPLAGFAGHLADVLPAQEGADLLCLDGLDAVAGHAADEEALFHFHNRARAGGATVIYAARATPAALAIALPDLATRLGQCTLVALAVLDEDGRRAALRERAARRGLELDDAVLDWLLRRVGRDLGTLTSLLDRLDRASLAAQRRLTVPFLREQLRSETGPDGL
jgi:DnaA family protein